ncbi:MAG: restriction endonuclease subunit S [Clostridiales bacterium]|nr:restriction endonuclease subunit S [Clostridiales bacterium]
MRVKLGDIFEIGSGGTPSKSHPEYYGGNIPWVKTGDLKNEYLYEVEDFITEEGLNNSSAKMYEEDTVLIAMYGATIGATSILKMKACTNQACAAFRKNEQVIPEYLYYFLRSQKEKFVKDGVGGAQPNISAGYLKKVEMELPSLDAQKVIVDILDKISDVVCKRSFELQSLDDLIKARFVELFGDPELNPMGWEQVTLNDVCSSIVRGAFGSALKKEFFVEPDETTYKVYEQKHAIQKSASIGTYYITEEKYQELKRFECLPGDILMSCSGTMGELYQLPDGCEKGVINQALCKFTLNERILPICFLVYMKQTIGNLETKGSGIQNIAAVSYVKQMPINLPPMDVQNEFEQFVHQVDKSKVVVQKMARRRCE